MNPCDHTIIERREVISITNVRTYRGAHYESGHVQSEDTKKEAVLQE
jgi:hypothetical protein